MKDFKTVPHVGPFSEVTGGHIPFEQGSKPRQRTTRGTGHTVSSTETYKEIPMEVDENSQKSCATSPGVKPSRYSRRTEGSKRSISMGKINGQQQNKTYNECLFGVCERSFSACQIILGNNWSAVYKKKMTCMRT